MSDLKVTTDVPNEIKMTRTFAAPRRLVIRAMTEPELLERWLGNSHGPIVTVECDCRVGGTWRHVYRQNDGTEFSFFGVFKEVGDDRMVHSEVFSGNPAEEAIVTTTWTERDGKTTMEHVLKFSSQAIRDMVIATGMERGASESYDNLADLVTKL